MSETPNRPGTAQRVPFGTSRTKVTRSYALIAPDSHVPAPDVHWPGTTSVTLISPAMGAAFAMSLVTGEAAAHTAGAGDGVERFAFVDSGRVRAEIDGSGRELDAGGFVYAPADTPHHIECLEPTRLWVFEKVFEPRDDLSTPAARIAHLRDVQGKPFLGDPDAVLQVLLPDAPEYDMAVNLFTYQPGATLPFAETHVMEHGMVMTAGAGVYRLDEDWFPVQKDDVMWIAPYCPQWFVAMGKQPASYLYYKDVNRDPLRAPVRR